MNPHGIPPGLVWQASGRYGNKIMSEDDMVDFFARAGMKMPSVASPDSRRRPDSKARMQSLAPPDPPRHADSEARSDSQVPDLQSSASPVHAERQESPTRSNRRPITPHSSRGRLPGRVSKSKARPSARQWQSPSNTLTDDPCGSSLSETPRDRDQVQENVLCDFCHVFVSSSRTIRMRPDSRGLEDKGLAVHVEEEYGISFVEESMHYNNLGDLHQSARDGCHLCSLLAALEPTVSEVSPSNNSKSYVLRVTCAQSYDGPGQIDLIVSGYRPKTIYLSYGAPSFLKIKGSLRYRRTDADEVFALAKSWLRTCLDDHEKCRYSAHGDDFIPTRLLKVTTSGPFLLSVQLCLTKSEDFPPHTPYLALSHCWGTTEIVKLKNSTLPTFLRAIPLSSLPPNFSDAALITARLGYTYLWIDALCIIQDSPDDWTHEAATMGNVYSSAACTISALGSADSRGGCFVTRNPLAFVPCVLRSGDDRDSVWVDNQQVRRPDSEGEMCPPLHRRAWVVQERALAPRTLHFGSEMVFWECVEGNGFEGEPWKKQTGYEHSRERASDPSVAQKMDLKMTLHTMRQLCRSGDWADWECFWWKMVQEYTASKLTLDKDKWAAFSGLAKEVEQHTRTRLYHGLWESNLFDELLWKVLEPGRKVDYDAPSWAWLSVDTGVRRQRYNYNMDFRQVATVSIPPSKETSTDGSYGSKKLAVRGRRLMLTWSVAHFGSGRKDYTFRLQDGREMPERYYDGRWNPDTVPDKSWQLSILQFVTTEYKESYGLVIRPLDASKTSWLRVGFYGMTWRDERKGDEFGDLETIMMV